MSRKWTHEIGYGYESILRDGVMVNKEQAVRALKNYESRIAELKAVIDQLIEAGEKMFTAVIAAADSYDEGMREWDKIVNDWKEG